MKSRGAREAKNAFGRLLDDARSEPVAIEKHGRAVAVVLSMDEYSRLEGLEEAYWALKADEAVAGTDWVGVEKSERALKDILNAKG